MAKWADAGILAATEVPYQRKPDGRTTADWLAQAVTQVLTEAELPWQAVDGLGVASFTHAPDRAIDLAWSLGLRPRWIMDDSNGGASALNLLQHALRAVAAGDANVVVLVAGDVFQASDFARLVDEYNHTTRAYLRPLGFGGPNALFAMLTQRQMQRSGLGRDDYGALVMAQRAWASRNPDAVYRQPLSLDDYRNAPMVAWPLCRLDCVPVVAGANAIVVAGRSVLRDHGRYVRVQALQALHNPDQQEGDGLTTGLRELRHGFWQMAGLGPEDIDVLSIYDDYPAMVLAQLADLGFAGPDDDLAGLIHRDLVTRRLPVNVSGGQLSAGQAGTAGGMHGLVECVRQLLGRCVDRQLPKARHALVTGYGMVEYRYGMCAAAAVLQRSGR